MTDLDLKPEKWTSALLHLTFQNNIHLKAHTTLMIELLCNSDEKIETASKRMTELYAEIQEEVVVHLNALYGNVDLSDLLGDDNKK